MTTARKPAAKKKAAKKKVTKKVAEKKTPPKKNRGTSRNGGARRNAGRKEGAATKRTRAIADKLAEEKGLTPLEYMLDVLRTGPDEIKAKHAAGELDDAEYMVALQAAQERRDWAAEKAAPYIHPRLASIEQKGAGGGQDDWLDIIEEGNEAGKRI